MSRVNTSASRGSIVGLVIAVFLLVLSLLVLLNRQYLVDWVAYSHYKPTPVVAAIAERTTMNDTGKFFFYSAAPSVDNAQKFNTECDRKEAGSAILGCYTGNRIYLYDVTDAQLDGIKDVTAAHEMLHVVYQRMSDGDKAAIDKLLEAEYDKLSGNKDLADRMAFYARNEAGERDNELHSILGTEFANLDPALEAHYAKYFTQRQAIVDLHSKYASIFEQLQAQTAQLADELQALSKKIQAESADYNAQVKRLNADISAFNTRATGKGFSSRSEFDHDRAALVARVSALDATRLSINAEIAHYETLRTKYNATADQSKQLYNSIDSSLAPAPSV